MPIRTIVFDFDGVLVESVEVKLEAYVQLFADQHSGSPSQIRAFCEPRLGLSRYRLIDAIYRDVLGLDLRPDARNALLTRYGELVVDQVVAAPWVPGAREFIAAHTGRYRLFIVSGTPQNELQEILRRRGMTDWFDGAFGSPTPKETLLAHVLTANGWRSAEAVYIGDTEHDWAAVRSLGIPFIWRRCSRDASRPAGFSGPVVDSLEELSSMLAALEAAAK